MELNTRAEQPIISPYVGPSTAARFSMRPTQKLHACGHSWRHPRSCTVCPAKPAQPAPLTTLQPLCNKQSTQRCTHHGITPPITVTHKIGHLRARGADQNPPRCSALHRKEECHICMRHALREPRRRHGEHVRPFASLQQWLAQQAIRGLRAHQTRQHVTAVIRARGGHVEALHRGGRGRAASV